MTATPRLSPGDPAPDFVLSLRSAGYEVVGLSPDPPAALARFRDAEGLSFPLLSDPASRCSPPTARPRGMWPN